MRLRGSGAGSEPPTLQEMGAFLEFLGACQIQVAGTRGVRDRISTDVVGEALEATLARDGRGNSQA